MSNEINIKDIDLSELLPNFITNPDNEIDKEEGKDSNKEKLVSITINTENNLNEEIKKEEVFKENNKTPEKELIENIYLPIDNEFKSNYDKISEKETFKQADELDDIIKSLEFGEEDLNYIENFNNTFDLISKNFNKYAYIVQERELSRKLLEKSGESYYSLQRDNKNIKVAITSLKNWYNNYKESIINELQVNINQMLNGFFKNNHRIILEQDVKRGNSTVSMVEVDSKGNKIGDINIILSGAERQMAGFLIQTSILNTVNSGFLILDEAFSSFGDEEVKRLPGILDNLDNMQLIIIEHKDKMYEDFPIKTIKLERDSEHGTYISEVVNV